MLYKYTIFKMDDIALEEDITGQVEDATKSALGGTVTTQKNPAGFDGTRDISKTDDIFGTKKNSSNSTKNEKDNEDANNDTSDKPEETRSTNTNDSDTGNDDMDDEDSDDENLEGDDTSTDDSKSSPPPLIYSKNKLRDSMVRFYDILENDIKLITDTMTKLNDNTHLNTCNQVLKNLRDAKEFLYDLITDELRDNTYEEILKKYIALRRVYDVSIEMLELHFKNSILQSKRKGSKRSFKK